MCDFSLDLVASRPAKVGDKLVTTNFLHTVTRGFASLDDRNRRVSLPAPTPLPSRTRCDAKLVLSSPGASGTG